MARDGIKRVWDALAGEGREAVRALLAPYLDAVAALNPAGTLRTYPGSPLIAQSLLRPQDRLIACELEPRSAAVVHFVRYSRCVLRFHSAVRIYELQSSQENAHTRP